MTTYPPKSGFILVFACGRVEWANDSKDPFATRAEASEVAEDLAAQCDGELPAIVSVKEHFKRYLHLMEGLRECRRTIEQDDDLDPLDVWHSLVGRFVDFLAASDGAVDYHDFCKALTK